MYNENIKKQFLNTLESQNKLEVKNKFLQIFRQTEPLEVKNRDDLYNIPLEIVLEYLIQNYSFSSFGSFRGISMRIREYKRWAIIEDLIDKDAKYFEDKKIVYSVFKNHYNTKLYKNPNELKEDLGKWLHKTDPNGITYDELCLAYCMLLYLGFTKDEIFLLTLDNIICTENYMLIKNERFATKVYYEFYPLLSKIYNNRKLAVYYGRKLEISDMGQEFIYDKNNNIEMFKRQITVRLDKIIHDNTIAIDKIYLMGYVFKGKALGITYKELCKRYFPNIKRADRENIKLLYEIW